MEDKSIKNNTSKHTFDLKKINNKCECGSVHWVTSHTLVSDWRIWQRYN